MVMLLMIIAIVIIIMIVIIITIVIVIVTVQYMQIRASCAQRAPCKASALVSSPSGLEHMTLLQCSGAPTLPIADKSLPRRERKNIGLFELFSL